MQNQQYPDPYALLRRAATMSHACLDNWCEVHTDERLLDRGNMHLHDHQIKAAKHVFIAKGGDESAWPENASAFLDSLSSN